MGKFDLYKLPLKSLVPGTHTYEYKLDDVFFRNIDATEVQRGKLDVVLSVKRTSDVFELNFNIEGVIQIPCDRCLDYMDFEVSTAEKLYVKFGKEYSEENDEVVIIPEAEGELNVAWFLYEFIALTMPLKHVHPPGKCNKSMSAKLRKHHVKDPDDDETEEEVLGDETDSIVDEEVETDPRWDELKKIIDNN